MGFFSSLICFLLRKVSSQLWFHPLEESLSSCKSWSFSNRLNPKFSSLTIKGAQTRALTLQYFRGTTQCYSNPGQRNSVQKLYTIIALIEDTQQLRMSSYGKRMRAELNYSPEVWHGNKAISSTNSAFRATLCEAQNWDIPFWRKRLFDLEANSCPQRLTDEWSFALYRTLWTHKTFDNSPVPSTNGPVQTEASASRGFVSNGWSLKNHI